MAKDNRKLPKFEGEDVKARELAVTGTIKADTGIDEPHKLGDEIVVIGTATIAKIGHERKGDAAVLTRLEGAKTSELFVVTDNTDALSLLQQARADREAAMDALLGRSRLPMDDEGAATDDKLAELLDAEAARDAAASEAEADTIPPSDELDDPPADA